MPGICPLQPQVHVEQGSLFLWGASTAPATQVHVLSCLYPESLHSKQPAIQLPFSRKPARGGSSHGRPATAC